ncbi:MAG: hypothetical protein QM686_08405 [Herbaspirillum sp.]|uniref:hypothetical protein n=1 Tax=Herbaspirillum sp. 1130 TaxID=2806562 RepID=UPI001AE46B86|nr:hypothetical protein [Herbaspirillum sp. 1130]MBP1314175.1 putative phage gp36 major capsid-like protein [Herbaspirillum sp. 1130]
MTHEHIRELFTQRKRGRNAQDHAKKIRKEVQLIRREKVRCAQSALQRNVTILDYITARVQQRQARTSEDNEEKKRRREEEKKRRRKIGRAGTAAPLPEAGQRAVFRQGGEVSYLKR